MRRRQVAGSARNEFWGSAENVVMVGGHVARLTVNVYGLPIRITKATPFRAFCQLMATVIGFVLVESLVLMAASGSRRGLGQDMLLAVAVALIPVGCLPLIVAYQKLQLSRGQYDRILFERVASAAASLARALREELHQEQRLRRLQDPFPLPVRWDNADDLADHWQAIRRDPGDGTPIDLSGALDLPRRLGIAEAFGLLPSRRLVITGPAGAGKSVVALRFALTMLEKRSASDPVPVIVPMASWHPGEADGEQDLWEWLASRLAIDHPALAGPGSPGMTLAQDLVRTGRILPVLDGFDELPAALRSVALRELNRVLDENTMVVLTTRHAEYASAVADGDVLTGSAVISLEPLSVDDLARYLPLTAKKSQAARWEAVLSRLHRVGADGVPDEAGERLLAVLATPLMTSLARAAYSDTGADPAELLDPERFGSVAALENHLVQQFIPAVYPSSAQADKARRYLEFLARDATRRGPAAEISWWQLSPAGPRLGQVLLVVCYVAMVVFVARFRFGRSAFYLASTPHPGFPNWLVLALATAPVLWYGLRRSRSPVPVRLGIRRRVVPFAGLVALTGIPLFLVVTRSSSFTPAVTVVWPLVLLCLSLALRLLRIPGDVLTASNPRAMLRSDRRAALTASLGNAAVGGGGPLFVSLVLTTPVSLLSMWDGTAGAGLTPLRTWLLTIAVALALVLAYGLGYTAWGGFAWTRLTRALQGRLPLRVMRFLDDAHRRGVLRQSGATYQFRHARLREQLAGGAVYQAAMPAGTAATQAAAVYAARTRRTRRRLARIVPGIVMFVGFCFVLGSIGRIAGPAGPFTSVILNSHQDLLDTWVRTLPGWSGATTATDLSGARVAHACSRYADYASFPSDDLSCEWVVADGAGHDDLSIDMSVYIPTFGASASTTAALYQRDTADSITGPPERVLPSVAALGLTPRLGACDWTGEANVLWNYAAINRALPSFTPLPGITSLPGSSVPSVTGTSQDWYTTASLRCGNLDIDVSYTPASWPGTGQASAFTDQILVSLADLLLDRPDG